ncbi:hypothetical protein SK803_43310 [Lentzea sp. BCCO 10_0856]|uniref:Uncharacterized protein n=1 Tax=Lentzea miocenica TaxID=3095431 RepID=A0ABU4TGS4_9PSEU|nr:hypothetical protein [Lentzea sp. BCCO 10_0856]MDX8037062.1 hypothetical protein [Lentzea sp. BCCO 10_0856]
MPIFADVAEFATGLGAHDQPSPQATPADGLATVLMQREVANARLR